VKILILFAAIVLLFIIGACERPDAFFIIDRSVVGPIDRPVSADECQSNSDCDVQNCERCRGGTCEPPWDCFICNPGASPGIPGTKEDTCDPNACQACSSEGCQVACGICEQCDGGGGCEPLCNSGCTECEIMPGLDGAVGVCVNTCCGECFQNVCLGDICDALNCFICVEDADGSKECLDGCADFPWKSCAPGGGSCVDDCTPCQNCGGGAANPTCTPKVCPNCETCESESGDCEPIYCSNCMECDPTTGLGCEPVECGTCLECDLDTGACGPKICPACMECDPDTGGCTPIVCPNCQLCNFDTNACEPVDCGTCGVCNPGDNTCEPKCPGFCENCDSETGICIDQCIAAGNCRTCEDTNDNRIPDSCVSYCNDPPNTCCDKGNCVECEYV